METRHEYEAHILYTAGEIAAGRRDRPVKKKNVRTKFLDKTRRMIEKADALDREKGRI